MYGKDGSVTQMSVVTVGYWMFVLPLRIVKCVGLVNKIMKNILGYPDSSGKDQMAWFMLFCSNVSTDPLHIPNE